MTRRSRRAVLATCGAGLAALAGCSGVDVTLGGEEREYEPGTLVRLTDWEVPARPDAFPVRVVASMVDRHYDRARELLAAVPAQPEVPNGVIARRIREDRERAADGLEERPDTTTGLERVEEARQVRSQAAEVDGAYRAAVGEIDRETVAERRDALRSELHGFEGEWAYRGGDPVRALVVHAELERLVGRTGRSAEAWPPFPDDPRDDVFRAGEVVSNVEEGRAALGDATRLRARYLEELTDPRSYRSAIAAASHRLERRAERYGRHVRGYLDRRASEAFDRSVQGTPAEELYVEARQRARGVGNSAEEARRAGDHATATLRAGTELVGLRAFEAVLDAVEAGEYGPPESGDRIVAAREDAVAALREAWGTEPVPVSVELTEPARDALQDAHYRLADSGGDARTVHRAYANIAYVRLYAERVPEVVGAVTAAVEGRG